MELHDRSQHRVLIIASLLVIRFLQTGGPAMLRMMAGPVTMLYSIPTAGARHTATMTSKVFRSD